MKFNTHGGDSELNNRSGEEIEIIGPLDENEYDKCETGPMFAIRFADGFETAAFADEIEED